MDNLGSMWARVGFIRHAPEFWLLVKVLLDKMNLPQSNLAQEESFAIPREAGSNTGLLAKFDDSDMSQVNALITSLQHVRITT
jgi:hypothetical protein